MISEDAVRRCLVRFPLYHGGHMVIVSQAGIVPDAVTISYRTKNGSHFGTTHLSIQVEGCTCYIVGIGLDPQYRGVGLGEELYQIAENIAVRSGCTRVVTHGSGKTAKGDTRKNYLKRRGYTDIDGSVEVEKIL